MGKKDDYKPKHAYKHPEPRSTQSSDSSWDGYTKEDCSRDGHSWAETDDSRPTSCLACGYRRY